MARIRSIKPTFFTSLSIGELPVPVRLTYIGLWTHCDDDGRCDDDVRLIKAAVWPLERSHVFFSLPFGPQDLHRTLDQLKAAEGAPA